MYLSHPPQRRQSIGGRPSNTSVDLTVSTPHASDDEPLTGSFLTTSSLRPSPTGPSGLTLSRQNYEAIEEADTPSDTPKGHGSSTPVSQLRSPTDTPDTSRPETMQRLSTASEALFVPKAPGSPDSSPPPWNENTPLLPQKPHRKFKGHAAVRKFVGRYFTAQYFSDCGKTAVKSIPAVLLGSLLNILDGVSCTFSRIVYANPAAQVISIRWNDYIPVVRSLRRLGIYGGLDVFRDVCFSFDFAHVSPAK
jgi:hypothetical protein